jgi:hypothetical protein
MRGWIATGLHQLDQGKNLGYRSVVQMLVAPLQARSDRLWIPSVSTDDRSL